MRGIHLLLIAITAGGIVMINSSSSDHPLRAYDRDLFSLLHNHHPEILRGLNLSFGLAGMDLSGVDLRSLQLARRKLKNINLKGSHLEQAEFNCVSMDNVNFTGANLKEASFKYKDDKCSIGEIKGDFRGADLSNALIQGDGNAPIQGDGQPCGSYITIKGKLSGTKFTGSTLRCVKLINTSSIPENADGAYAGMNFVGAVLDRVELVKGDFTFSDFYKAQVVQLEVGQEANLRFSTLAELKCGSGGYSPQSCQLNFAIPVKEKLSLNMRGSRIKSNLQLPSSAKSWPALLCDEDSQWDKWRKVEVKEGDTLEKIADTNGISLMDLQKANPDITNANLKHHRQLELPVETETARTVKTETARIWIMKNETPTCEPL